ncbi:MAG: class I SAM-dependent methyltransferase [Blastocatellia bacterium]|nr:class I SAM-dependent methyltransferase [Blastocatellia bacterium]
MPLLSEYAQKKKIGYFIDPIPKEAKILEVGAGSCWLSDYLKKNGWKDSISLDLQPPADIIGSIFDWRMLAITEASFDVIVAFEVVEHVHCFKEFYDILKPDGLLMLTSPLPHMDWICKILEAIGLNQKRTSPHDHLIYFKDIPLFTPIDIRVVGFIAQWGIFKKVV